MDMLMDIMMEIPMNIVRIIVPVNPNQVILHLVVPLQVNWNLLNLKQHNLYLLKANYLNRLK